ncbi:MFS transporter [Vibrio tritonius]|uniref:MFS transporter n=1 Tax=Vibrio tritonius TaxID=1435069 RepID=UPI000838DF2C|nr:MFS transporter [Vibrio tritonius]
MKKTPYKRLVPAAMIGVGTSVAPLVLLMFGIIQFNIIRLVGESEVTAMFGICAGISSFALVVLSPLGGFIADRTYVKFGRRRFWILLGSLGGCICMYFFANATSIFMLACTWIFAQFFYGMVTNSSYSIVPEQVDQEKFGRVSGFIGASAPAFVMLGSMIVMGYFSAVSVQDKILMIAFGQLVGGLIATLLIIEPASVKPEVEVSNKDEVKGKNYFYPSFKLYPEYTWALLTKLLINFTNAGLSMTTLFYIARFAMDEKSIFELNAFTSMGIALMVGSGLLGGFLSDKVRKQKPFVIMAAMITGVCMIAFAFSHNITLVIISNFIFNLGFGMYNAVDNALVNRILPSKDNYTKDISIMNVTTQLASSLVTFVAPVIIAFGAATFGDDGYTFFFLLLAGFSILSAVVVFPIPEVGKPLKKDLMASLESGATEAISSESPQQTDANSMTKAHS